MANSKQRRNLRRMLQRAGLSMPPSPPPPPPITPKRKLWRQIPRWLYAAVGGVGLLITLTEALPWLSIAEGDRLDAANPFSQIFIIKNEGYLPIFSPDVTCDKHVKLVAKDGRVGFETFHFTAHGPYPPMIVHEGTFTASCYALELNFSPSNIAANVPGSMLDIKITYGFWQTIRPFWRRAQSFHFETRSWDDGKTQQWVQEGRAN
jgi:hypothetical protein